MKKIICLIAAVLLCAAFFCGCEGNEREEGKIYIVASDFPAYDFARQVAGDLAEVKMLVSPGNGVHSYEPSPRDILDICGADLFIYTGGESDIWVKNILESNGEEVNSLKMTDAVEMIPEEEKEGMEADEPEEGEEYDEHVWTSPLNAVKICEAIKDALCVKYPEYSEDFTSNCEEYTGKIEALDASFRELFNGEKDEGSGKVLIFGDRFPFLYFAKEYGIDYYAAFPGCSEETEANPSTIIFLKNKIKELNVKKVFYIELSSGNIARVLAEETGTETALLHSCHNVTADEFEKGETYLSLMTANYQTLKEALS